MVHLLAHHKNVISQLHGRRTDGNRQLSLSHCLRTALEDKNETESYCQGG